MRAQAPSLAALAIFLAALAEDAAELIDDRQEAIQEVQREPVITFVAIVLGHGIAPRASKVLFPGFHPPDAIERRSRAFRDRATASAMQAAARGIELEG